MVLMFWHQSIVCFSMYRSVPSLFHSETVFARKKLPSSKQKQICFVCTTPRKDDFKSYNFVGLGKCMEDRVAAKLQECSLVGQETEDSRFKLANDRLRVSMADAHHIFDVDILCHKKYSSSYLTQARKKRYSQEEIKILNERKCEE